ncbi:unnamed protein product [Closterium sp. Naga37s-1]|nr:unnamed protein product [Closterium sp. Naga37s-1]
MQCYVHPAAFRCRASLLDELSHSRDRRSSFPFPHLSAFPPHSTMTLKAVRLALEGDMGLAAGALNAHKDLVRDLVDQLFSDEGDVDEAQGEKDEKDDKGEKERVGKKVGSGVKPAKTGKKAGGKDKRQGRKGKEEEDDEKQGEEEEEKEEESSAAAPRSAAVERLKKVFQACGLRVPPNVYKKARQAAGEAASAGQHEAALVGELEALLDREGLSSHPSEKEIKAFRRRRDKAKELEGIDVSNIVDAPRGRRSSRPTSFAPPQPPPRPPSKPRKGAGGSEDGEGQEEEEEGDEEDEDEEEEEEEEEENDSEDFEPEDDDEDD